MIVAIVILTCLVILLGYISFNMFRKIEFLERAADSQQRYIQKFSGALQEADKKLENIDEKGSFQSDDEIGWFFESIKTLQRELNDFNNTPI